MSRWPPSNVSMSPSPAEIRAAAVSSGLHPLLQQLFTAWHRESLAWCVLRMPDNTFAPDSDIDLLIDSANLAAAAAIAESQRFVRLPGKHRGLHLITYHSHTGTWLWLHCVTELRFGPHEALRGDAASTLLQRRLPNSLPRLSPGDEFWVTLAHCLLDRHKVVEKHRRRLAILAGQASGDGVIAHRLEGLLPLGVTREELLHACQFEDWDALERLIPGLVEAASQSSRPNVPRRATQLAKRVFSGIKETRLRRGLSVALLGPDGAGKSTLAAGIESTFVFPVRQVYMGLTGGMLRHVDRLRVPGVVRLGRLVVIWGRYLLAKYHISRGRLVVFDRYIYDAEVPTPYPLSLANRLGRWIDGRCCPAPDLILLLDAPGDVMHQRKPSYTPEMIENWRQHFLRLRQRFPQMEVIDTTQPADVVRAQATDLVWRQYVRRWER